MNRRDFLTPTRSRKQAVGKRTTAKITNTSLNPYTGWNTDPTAVHHLLRRTLFGLPLSAVNYFKSMSLQQSVTQLLTISADPPPVPPANYWTTAYHQQMTTDFQNGIIPAWLQVDPPPPVNDYNYNNGVKILEDPDVPHGMPWVASFNNITLDGQIDPERRWHRYVSFMGWWGRQIMEQNSNIREKMTLFWHNHFSMRILNDGQHYRKPTRYWNNALLRYHALGNFKALIKAITLDPQMMYMLNLNTNGKNNINENYARELQELYTLGMEEEIVQGGVETGNTFTDKDVNELAKLLTGWYYNNAFDCQGGCKFAGYWETVFGLIHHDTGDKQFSSFYNNTVIQGQSGANAGEIELDAFFDMLFNIRGLEIGKHLAREIYRFFVRNSFAYNPQSSSNDPQDVQIEQDIIVPLANQFVNSNYEIKPMMETLLQSEHFFSDCIRGGMIKAPIDFSTGLCKELDIFPANYYAQGQQINDINVEANAYRTMALSEVSRINQSIENPINVWGWDAYVNPPYGNNWVNGAIYARRLNLMTRLTNHFFSNLGYNFSGANGYLKTTSLGWYAEAVDFINIMNIYASDPADMDILVDETVETFLPVPIHSSVKDELKKVLTDEQPGHWNTLWANYLADPTNQTNIDAVIVRLREFYRAIFTLEEYHIM